MPKGIPKNGINKGWFKKGIKHDPMSQKTKKKLSDGRIGEKHWHYGKKLPLEWRIKISDGNKGKIISSLTRKKIGKANKGKNNWRWTGDNVSYNALHKWVRKNLIKSNQCQFCGKQTKWLDWANKSHKYRRKLTDWLCLCRNCHKRYDLIYKGKTPVT